MATPKETKDKITAYDKYDIKPILEALYNGTPMPELYKPNGYLRFVASGETIRDEYHVTEIYGIRMETEEEAEAREELEAINKQLKRERDLEMLAHLKQILGEE